MNKKLYVGGVPYSSTEDALRAAFAVAGAVTAVSIIMDRITNRSRGFAFVEMESEEAAQKAIEMLDGKEFEGRTLSVSFARPQERNGDRGGDRGGRSFGGGRREGGFNRDRRDDDRGGNSYGGQGGRF